MLILTAESARMWAGSASASFMAVLYGLSPLGGIILAIGVYRAIRAGKDKRTD
jgi:hypothetical protein